MEELAIEHKIISKSILATDGKIRIIKLELLAPIIAKNYLPGQFVILMVTQNGERIPLTIVDTDTTRGTITIIFQEIGYTTKLLGNLSPQQNIYHLLGPLGKPTEIKNFGKVIIIGGGVGAAEIYPVAKSLKSVGNKIITILGARTKNLVLLEPELRKVSDEVYVTTDDGSYGEKGVVTDVLKKLLTQNEQPNLVYAVGPIVMMRAVAEVTKPFGIQTIVSLNTIMVDGTGMCGSCRVTIEGKIKLVCCDGPEFDAHKVDWEELIKRNNIYISQEKEILEWYKL